jgi:hypothetical protein
LIELPTQIVKKEAINPLTAVIYGPPKIGKTTLFSKFTTTFTPVGKSLLVSLEPNGASYNDAVKVEINSAKELKDLVNQLIEEKPYDYVIFDTLTKIDEWSEIGGTFNYMKKPQGSKFNRRADGSYAKHTDRDFETVHDLGQGYGYKHSREWFLDLFDKMSICANKGVIFSCHIKDKFVGAAVANDDYISTKELNLTGKLANIIPSRVDAIGKLTRDQKNNVYVNFENGNDLLISGGRCAHLEGEILLSEMVNDEVVTHWNKIYLKD